MGNFLVILQKTVEGTCSITFRVHRGKLTCMSHAVVWAKFAHLFHVTAAICVLTCYCFRCGDGEDKHCLLLYNDEIHTFDEVESSFLKHARGRIWLFSCNQVSSSTFFVHCWTRLFLEILSSCSEMSDSVWTTCVQRPHFAIAGDVHMSGQVLLHLFCLLAGFSPRKCLVGHVHCSFSVVRYACSACWPCSLYELVCVCIFTYCRCPLTVVHVLFFSYVGLFRSSAFSRPTSPCTNQSMLLPA